MQLRARIDLAYDGHGWHGFARQPDVPTVQGTLEGALTRVCGLVSGPRAASPLPVVDARVDTTCAGRTDAGVHALGQVVHVDLDGAWGGAAAAVVRQVADDPERVRARLDALVGPAITLWHIEAVDDDFDARFSAIERRYRYLLTDAVAVDPRGRGLRWDVGAPLDVAAMHEAAQLLVGEHDFASLCRRAQGGHTRRKLDAIAVTRGPDSSEVMPQPPTTLQATGERAVQVTLRGPAFCHQQVRSIVGCLVEIGRERRQVGWMARVLAGRDRSLAARVAPAQGLTLEGVGYPAPWRDGGAPPAMHD